MRTAPFHHVDAAPGSIRRPTVDAFNPDQPRDKDGKFGSGGAGTGSSGKGAANAAVAHHAKAQELATRAHVLTTHAHMVAEAGKRGSGHATPEKIQEAKSAVEKATKDLEQHMASAPHGESSAAVSGQHDAPALGQEKREAIAKQQSEHENRPVGPSSKFGVDPHGLMASTPRSGAR